jgi:hypothetical protein
VSKARDHAICILALAGAVVAASSCTPRHVEPRATGIVVRSERTGWYIKKVVAKDPPEMLLADDGTICRVSPDRYRGTAVGTAVRCNWQ